MTHYNPLQLYYLNQLGIVPWVQRTKETEAIKLAVILPEQPSQKGKNLLKQMLLFVGLPENEVHITSSAALNKSMPLAALALGVAPSDTNFPIFSGENLEFILNNPSCKKQIFSTLANLKVYLGL